MTVTHIIRLTRSQQMALASILVTYVRLPNEPQEFLNVSEDVTTTSGELLVLVIDMKEMEFSK